jgi:CRP-like cAMP-binding protein
MHNESLSQSESAVLCFIQGVMPMPNEKAQHIAALFQRCVINKHDFLLRDGKICTESHFLESGYIRAFTFDPEGNEVTTSIFAPSAFVNDVSSFFKREPSCENIQALTDAITWAIPYEQLQASFHAMPEFREFGRMMLIMSNSSLKERMLSMIRETAEERYAALLKAKPDIFLHVPLKIIASYLGITDTSLSRIRRDFMLK